MEYIQIKITKNVGFTLTTKLYKRQTGSAKVCRNVFYGYLDIYQKCLAYEIIDHPLQSYSFKWVEYSK